MVKNEQDDNPKRPAIKMAIGCLGILAISILPFGLWKVYDIIVWLCTNVTIGPHT